MKNLKVIFILVLILSTMTGCNSKNVNEHNTENPDFAETRAKVEKTTRETVRQTGNNLMYIKDLTLNKADETLDDQSKEDLANLKEDLNIIGKNSGEAIKEIYEDTVSDETKAKLKNIGDIISNKTRNAINEINHNEK